MNKWDKRFLRLAREVSLWSKDPSTQTGAVLVSPDRTDVIIGYNGFARGMLDDEELYEDRNQKYDRVLHCEVNAVLLACRPVRGYSLFTYPFLSCHRCAVHMIQAGIVRVIAPLPAADKVTRWAESFGKSRTYFKEAHIEVCEFDLSVDGIG